MCWGLCVPLELRRFGVVVKYGEGVVQWGALGCVFGSKQQACVKLHCCGRGGITQADAVCAVLCCAAGAIEEEEDDEL